MTAEPDGDLPLVEVILEDGRWAEIGLSGLAEAAATAVLDEFGLPPEAYEISLLACNDVRIATLNNQFRGKDRPTNVLSWPSSERDGSHLGNTPIFLGDMALAFETCAREAVDADLTLSAHVSHLIVHGVLHLLGQDHQNDEEACEMERNEVKILASIGVGNPYK
jgi:probable rRNA maturation factor